MGEKYINNRIPLPDGTKLTKNITIVKLLSQSGGSSLAYLAKDGGVYCVIKEYYPAESEVELVRDGYRVVIENRNAGVGSSGAFLQIQATDYVQESQKAFERELSNANIVGVARERDVLAAGEKACDAFSNSIYHFSCSSITEEVLQNEDFGDTLALYMKIDTKLGLTLDDFVRKTAAKENQTDITLEQALTFVRYILLSLREMHEEHEMLHSDIKPDNLYWPSQLPWKNTYCIILDCGSARPIDASGQTIISGSDGYMAYEVQQAIKYSPHGQVPDARNAQLYAELVGTHTDLYSVGAIAYKLVMGKNFDPLIWMKINTAKSQKTVIRMINESIGSRVLSQYPYLADRIVKMFARALYVPKNSRDKNELLTNRYCRCAEFIEDIEVIIEILNQKGIHPEVVAAKSRERFEIILRNENVKFEGDPITNENLFIRDWFPRVFEENT